MVGPLYSFRIRLVTKKTHFARGGELDTEFSPGASTDSGHRLGGVFWLTNAWCAGQVAHLDSTRRGHRSFLCLRDPQISPYVSLPFGWSWFYNQNLYNQISFIIKTAIGSTILFWVLSSEFSNLRELCEFGASRSEVQGAWRSYLWLGPKVMAVMWKVEARPCGIQHQLRWLVSQL